MATKKKRKVVTIKRSKWAAARRLAKWNKEHAEYEECYGEKEQVNCDVEPALLAENGMMCCLGFVCNQAIKVPQQKLKDLALPFELKMKGVVVPEWLTDIENEAAELNDDHKITDAQREVRLKKLFREKSPIDLKFVP